MQVLTLRGRTALLAALAALAIPARGLDLGEVEVLSGIGEKLDARIPLRVAPGEWFHVTCLTLSGGAGTTGLPALADGIVSVERRSRSSNLRVRSATPINEPAVGFSVISTCADGSPTASRQFAVLLDLPRVDRAKDSRKAPPPATPARAAAPRAPQPVTRNAAAPTPAPAMAPSPAPAATPASPAPAVPAPPAVPSPSATAQRGSRFVLRLSSEPIDVSRSRGFDDKSRAVLRERLRLLDNDDQVAAMLALRDNMQRLEARVAELQLKLAAAPANIPPPRPAPAPAPSPAPPPVKVDATTKAEPPKVEAPATPAKAAPSPKAAVPTPSSPPAPAYEAEWLPGGPLPWLGALALLLVAGIAWLWKRRRAVPDEAAEDADLRTTAFEPPPRLEQEAPIEIAAPLHEETHSMPAVAVAAAAPTSAPEDPVETLRRRYIEERFPEIRDRTIVLDDPASVVKGARLFYEDGALPRAVELLRFATEDRPDAIPPWLALFEIYRLERLTGEYADLAGRFGARHGASDKWEKVRSFGREIDPGNPAYAEAPLNALETIGPAAARRRAAAHADPIAENWLDAPMDFENEVLATELRRALMARASVDERDLAPNPMPALRSVEMFSVG